MLTDGKVKPKRSTLAIWTSRTKTRMRRWATMISLQPMVPSPRPKSGKLKRVEDE